MFLDPQRSMHDVQVYVYGWYLAVIHLCRCEKLKWILFLWHLLCTRRPYWEHARAMVLNLGVTTLQGLHIRDLVSQVFTLPFKTVAKLYLWCNNENTLWLGSPHMMNCIKGGAASGRLRAAVLCFTWYPFTFSNGFWSVIPGNSSYIIWEPAKTTKSL